MIFPYPIYWPCIALAFWETLLKPSSAQVIMFDRHYREAVKASPFFTEAVKGSLNLSTELSGGGK